MSFTLFVILPGEDVCTLRGVKSGASIRAMRKRLELEAGLCAQTYRLTCAEGQVLHEEHVLHLDVNVWEGFVVRAHLLDSWHDLYDSIVAGDVELVLRQGAVQLRGGAVTFDSEDANKVRDIILERGTMALFLASFLGQQEMCKALLSVGVNPNGRTPHGRTPLFAALSRDNDHVMETLLAYGADLAARDVDGMTPVGVARRLPTKLCLRKIQLRLNSKVLPDARLGDQDRKQSKQSSASSLGVRANHVTKMASESPRAESGLVSLSSSVQGPGAVKLFREDRVMRQPSSLSSRPSSQTASERRQDAKDSNDDSSMDGSSRPRRFPPPTSSIRSGRSEVFTWEGTARRVPSSPGIHITRVSALRSEGSTNGGRGTAGVASGVAWIDSASAKARPKVLPHKLAVQEFSFCSPGTVLSTPSSSVRPVNARSSLDRLSQGRNSAMAQATLPKTLLKYFKRSGLKIQTGSDETEADSGSQDAVDHGAPSRPPSRSTTPLTDEACADDTPERGSVAGSQGVHSVASAPELQASHASDPATGSSLAESGGLQGDSDDDGGRVRSRGGALRSSGRQGARVLESRQRQTESWRTKKRRIKMAEDQKWKSREVSKSSPDKKEAKETFDQWLERKRTERMGCRHGRDMESSKDDGDESDDKDVERSQAFETWLKELKQRPLARPRTAAADSLRSRQGRPLQNLIQVGGNADDNGSRPDPRTYMSAYKEWQEKRSSALSDTIAAENIKDAKRRLEEKRKQLLAMALTYEEWLQHAEERKQLMHAILRADLQQLMLLEQQHFQTRRAPRHISFAQWRASADRRQAEALSHAQRTRRLGVPAASSRSSAAIPHEEWVRRKEEAMATTTTTKQRGPAATGPRGREAEGRSEAERHAAWEAWLQQKHRQELAEMDRTLHQERRLLFSVRPKKTPTVTQC